MVTGARWCDGAHGWVTRRCDGMGVSRVGSMGVVGVDLRALRGRGGMRMRGREGMRMRLQWWRWRVRLAEAVAGWQTPITPVLMAARLGVGGGEHGR